MKKYLLVETDDGLEVHVLEPNGARAIELAIQQCTEAEQYAMGEPDFW